MKVCILALFILVTSRCVAQPLAERYSAYGELIVKQLSTAPFPHPGRANGHLYDGTTYDEAGHYRDSSVALFVPSGYGRSLTVDLVFYFHGWGNNIDTALARYAVIEQFSASRRNAILVLPEAAYNAPDGFGGKLEDKDGVKRLVADVMRVLKNEKKVRAEFLKSFVIVRVNFSPEHKNEGFLGIFSARAGYPHFFVLEKDGKLLASQDTGKLEKGRFLQP